PAVSNRQRSPADQGWAGVGVRASKDLVAVGADLGDGALGRSILDGSPKGIGASFVANLEENRSAASSGAAGDRRAGLTVQSAELERQVAVGPVSVKQAAGRAQVESRV